MLTNDIRIKGLGIIREGKVRGINRGEKARIIHRAEKKDKEDGSQGD